jgi:transcriptional regulator with XRE-family HTH domain
MHHKIDPPFEAFDSFEQFFDQVEKRAGYWEERAKLEFTREVLLKMNKEGVSKTELANRLEVQPGMVTRLLSGRNNFELSTMVRMAMAVKCRFRSFLESLGTTNIVIDMTNLNNCFLTSNLVNTESFKPTSQVIFTSMINKVSDAGKLAENSQSWRKSHANVGEIPVGS